MFTIVLKSGETMNSIGIIGNGFVGNAVFQGMKEFFNICVYDNDPLKSHNTFSEAGTCDIIFICVPTPMDNNGNFDVSIIKSVISKLSSDKILIIKSTITPEFADYLVNFFPNYSLVFNPEFLTERTAVHDFKNPSRIVLGSSSTDALIKVENMYRKVFSCRLLKIIKTDVKTACFIKYFSNCFFASKVSLVNEFKQIADADGIDWTTALDGLLTSGWVNPMHTKVPGPDGDRGFGGKCFPKDLNAFIKYSENLNVDPKIMKSSWDKNLEIRSDLNWLQINGVISKKGDKNES